MAFVRDWDSFGPIFETEDEAYDDFLENLHIYIDEVFEEFEKRVSLYKLLMWATQQEDFFKAFGDAYDAAMRQTFEENYPEHEEEDYDE